MVALEQLADLRERRAEELAAEVHRDLPRDAPRAGSGAGSGGRPGGAQKWSQTAEAMSSKVSGAMLRLEDQLEHLAGVVDA